MNDNMNNIECEYIPTNREKTRMPKSGLFWCCCDRQIVGEWEKCPVCSRRNGIKREKQ